MNPTEYTPELKELIAKLKHDVAEGEDFLIDPVARHHISWAGEDKLSEAEIDAIIREISGDKLTMAEMNELYTDEELLAIKS
ncbi:unnamed protein product [marine sediment metagenome]|uniref:Uncharacterized protein n=1 Tax=marine sediment metagenome TaxID=412755 RepID=X1Q7Z2_9ZZZZ